MTVIQRPFDRAVNEVLHHEGGARLSDHPHDPGGATRYGISLRFAGSVKLDINGDGFTTKADIIALARQQAVELYRVHFWLPLRCGEMPPPIAYPVFDSAVNQGTGAAARLLQRAVGVTQDGEVGPVTLGAVNKHSDELAPIIAEFMAHRNVRYCRLAIESVKARSFLLGWYRRTAQVEATAVQWINK